MNRWLAGIGAALVAEGVFVAMVALVNALRGQDAWSVVKVPASFFLGADVVRPAGFVPGDVLAGAVVHVVFSVLVGLAFAWLLPRSTLTPWAGGLVMAALLYVFGFWLLPLVFPRWLAPFWLPPTSRALQAVAHAVYGLVLGFVYARLATAGVEAVS